jgi:cyclophilin family peptidyl-prolyl cis-trans isomerase
MRRAPARVAVLVVLVLLAVAAAAVTGCSASSTTPTAASNGDSGNATTGTTLTPASSSSTGPAASGATGTTAGTSGAASGTTFPGGKKPVVVIDTSLGAFTLELDPAKAPITVQNFLTYVRSGFYDGTIFHRVIPGFMIQGGGLTPDLQEKPTRAPIKNEAANGLKNTRGTIAMARTSEVDSATSQFFINVADNANLDHTGDSPEAFGYAVFGTVTRGMDVVDKIVGVPTTTSGQYENVPVTPVTIKSIRVTSGA